MSAPVPTTLGDHGQRLPSRCYGATVREFLRAAEGIGLIFANNIRHKIFSDGSCAHEIIALCCVIKNT